MSADPPARLARWAAERGLPYPLLGDEGRAVLGAWGAWRATGFLGLRSAGVARATFLVGKDGRIARAWPRAFAPGHAREVLAAVRSLPP